MPLAGLSEEPPRGMSDGPVTRPLTARAIPSELQQRGLTVQPHLSPDPWHRLVLGIQTKERRSADDLPINH